MANESILQVPLTAEYRDKVEQHARRLDRTAARQVAYIVKAFYDGRLTWVLPEPDVADVPTEEGGAA